MPGCSLKLLDKNAFQEATEQLESKARQLADWRAVHEPKAGETAAHLQQAELTIEKLAVRGFCPQYSSNKLSVSRQSSLLMTMPFHECPLEQ